MMWRSGQILIMDSPVLTLDQARTRIAEAADEIRALGVVRLAPFGSVPRGTPDPESDINLLVFFSEGAKTFDRFFAEKSWGLE